MHSKEAHGDPSKRRETQFYMNTKEQELQTESMGIRLPNGLVALVDAVDYDDLVLYHWRAIKRSNTFYVYRNATKRESLVASTVYMHRQVVGVSSSAYVDHINRNGLDNRRANLRTCNPAENAQHSYHRKRYACTSTFKGVSRQNSKWRAQIWANKKRILLGRFNTETEAAIAYNEAAKRLHGEFAALNIITQ